VRVEQGQDEKDGTTRRTHMNARNAYTYKGARSLGVGFGMAIPSRMRLELCMRLSCHSCHGNVATTNLRKKGEA